MLWYVRVHKRSHSWHGLEQRSERGRPQQKQGRGQDTVLRESCLQHPVAATGAVKLHQCTPVSQKVPNPADYAASDALFQEADTQKAMVDRIVGPDEIKRQEHVFRGQRTVWNTLASCFGFCHPSCTVRTRRPRVSATDLLALNPTCSGGTRAFCQ